MCPPPRPSKKKPTVVVSRALLGPSLLSMALSKFQLNTNGITNSDKRAGLLQWLQSLSVVSDVVCLQEIYCVSSAECLSWFRSSAFQSVVSPGSQKSCCCVILFRLFFPSHSRRMRPVCVAFCVV